MGRILKINCASCGKEWQYAVGSGMYLAGQEEILNAFSEKEKAEAESMFETCDPPGSYDFHYSLGICRRCKSVVRVPVFVTHSAGEKNTLVGGCPQCGKQVKASESAWKEAEENRETCPSCSGGTLSIKTVGRWD